MVERLSAEYDRDADVLYIVTPYNAPAVAKVDRPGMVWRYETAKGTLVGLTLIDFQGYWAQHLPEVAVEMSKRFGVPAKYAIMVLEDAA